LIDHSDTSDWENPKIKPNGHQMLSRNNNVTGGHPVRIFENGEGGFGGDFLIGSMRRDDPQCARVHDMQSPWDNT
jgi:hypothetical protein